MSINIGNLNIADVKIGDSQISAIYAGDVLIWANKGEYIIGYSNHSGDIFGTEGELIQKIADDGYFKTKKFNKPNGLQSWITTEIHSSELKPTITKIDKIVILSTSTTLADFFRDMVNLESLTLDSDFNTSNVTDFSGCFYNSTCLKNLDISSWNLSNCKDLSEIFDGCSNLQSIGNNVVWKGNPTNCNGMFNNCSQLTNAGDFSALTLVNANCEYMFYNCSSLYSSITLKGSISNARGLFNECRSLKYVNLMGIDWTNCTDMSYMFNYCQLNSNYEFVLYEKDLSKVTALDFMFARRGQVKIKKVDLSNNIWRSAGVSCQYMFRFCEVETVNLKGLKAGTNISYMFYQNVIDYIDVRGLDTSNTTNMAELTGLATEPLEVQIDCAFFNSNVASFPIEYWYQAVCRNNVLVRVTRDQEVAKLNMLFDALIKHPKVEDPNWDGQEVRLRSFLNEETTVSGFLNFNNPNKEQSLIDNMNEAIDLGWTISFV